MTEKFIPTHAISHMDLDGMCAGVLIRKCFGISVKYCGYTSLDRIYTKMMETEGSRVILTDLSLTDEQYNRYREKFERGEAIIIDHHETTTPIEGCDGVVFDQKYAGSSLTFMWLLKNYPEYAKIVIPYKDFAFCTEDFDLWIHNDWRSSVWNALLYRLGFWKVEKRFRDNPSANFTDVEKVSVKVLLKERQKTKDLVQKELSIVESKDGSHRLAMIHCAGMDLPPFIFEELHNAALLSHDFTLLIRDDRYSMRSTDLSILDSVWKDIFRGHHLACGNAPGSTIEDIFKVLEEHYDVD